MFQEYEFRKICLSEVEAVFNLIVARMQWMDSREIKQWNVMNYDKAYPLSYYEKVHDNLYVLVRSTTGEIVCAAVLFEADEKWNNDEPAYYIHNFVSKIGSNHAGSVFLNYAEQLAKEKGKLFLRLDSADDNAALTAYYESYGFYPVGTCTDGPYHGTLRQKQL